MLLKCCRPSKQLRRANLAEFVEEHTGEDGLLADATNDSGNITASSVKARLKALTPDLVTLHETQDNDDEQDALEHCLSLLDAKSKADKAVKEAQLALDKQVLVHYATLTEDEIKALVVEDKWLANIQAAITDEVQQLTQELDRSRERTGGTLCAAVAGFSARKWKGIARRLRNI